MTKVRAYHAGDAKEIDDLIAGQPYMTPSYHGNNWLGEGLYFWENNANKAEKWQLEKGKGAILQCDIDTQNLLNLLEDTDSSDLFFEDAKALSEKHKSKYLNNRSSQKFELDCQIFNEYRRKVKGQFSGVRMAFYLGESVSKDGNIFTGQHIQICLWDLTAIQNPSKYVPCKW